MFFKIAVVACIFAVSNAGFTALPYALSSPALTSTSDNVLRTPGNLAQISTQSKTVSTPFSSASRSELRVSNPGIYAQAPLAYAAPATPYAYGAYAAPASPYAYAAPVAHAAPLSYAAAPVAHAAAPGASLLGVAYSPAVAVSHMTYSSPIGISYSY